MNQQHGTRAGVVERPDPAPRDPHYVANRAPLLPSPLLKLPLGAIVPGGWLRTQLERMAGGMVGRLAEISPFLAREDNAWLSPAGEGHSPGEEVPYWLRGFGDLGHVLGDERILEEAGVWLDGLLRSQQADGWFGPRSNRVANDVWPNMVALDCLRSLHEATGDARVLEHLTRYFRWQLAHEDLLPGSWQQVRGGDNLESVHWLYNRTGEPFLLALAEKVHARTADWTRGLASPHGVNICQGFREPAQYYRQSKDPAHLEATIENYRAVMARHGQVPGGMFGADENCRDGHHDPRQGAEACSMVEFLRSFEVLGALTGDPAWADRCEEVAFNTLPAAMTPDLTALHYLTAPNQVRLDGASKSPGVENAGCMFAYSPHRYRCCQHNVSHGWPCYAEALWHATPDRGLCASLYARSTVAARAGEGTRVRIEEATDYPFGEPVRFTLACPRPVRFPLYLRVPGWCEDARVAVNGRPVLAGPEPGRYVVLERTWQDGDRVALDLPMKIRVTMWAQNGRSMSVSRGPLTFSLRIGERWVKFTGAETWPKHESADRPSTPAWPAWEVHPTSPWNYALALDPDRPERDLEVAGRAGPPPAQPFTLEDAPIAIRAPARRLETWRLEDGLVAPVPPSPVRTGAAVETVTLVPMGCARLRISAFPVAAAR